MKRNTCVFLLAIGAFGQTMPPHFDVQGVLVSEEAGTENLRVTAMNVRLSGSTTMSYVGYDGSFQFRGLEEGTYEFNVVNKHGDVLQTALVTVPAYNLLRITMPKQGKGAGGAVSLYRLSHKVNSRAWKAWQRSEKALESGKEADAEKLLDEAIEADPEFADALHVRGLFAIRAKDIPRAMELCGKAAALDGASPKIQTDAAWTALVGGQQPAAEQYARTALRLDSANTKAHFILALALWQQHKDRKEVAESLRRARTDFPKAGELLKSMDGEGH